MEFPMKNINTSKSHIPVILVWEYAIESIIMVTSPRHGNMLGTLNHVLFVDTISSCTEEELDDMWTHFLSKMCFAIFEGHFQGTLFNDAACVLPRLQDFITGTS